MDSKLAWYDAAEWYDLAFAWDPKTEVGFLRWAFERFAKRRVRTVLEPGCGSGHFLIPLRRDHEVIGFDINPAMVALVNRKAAAAGVGSPTVYRGDFSRFDLACPVDASYMLIDTLRHLTTRRELARHFRCLHRCVAPGGVHVLGMDLIDPDAKGRVEYQSWTTERGDRSVRCTVGTWRGPDERRRQDHLESVLECRDGEKRFDVRSRYRMRRLSWEELVAIARIGEDWEHVWTTDLHYCTDEQLDPVTRRGDVVLVLVRRNPPRSSRKPAQFRSRS